MYGIHYMFCVIYFRIHYNYIILRESDHVLYDKAKSKNSFKYKEN